MLGKAAVNTLMVEKRMCAGPKYFAVFISALSSGAKDFESYLNK